MKKEGKPQRTFIEQFLPVKEISTEAKKESYLELDVEKNTVIPIKYRNFRSK